MTASALERVPAWPEDMPSSHRGGGIVVTRYEDISQDGRLGLRALSHGIGAALWRDSLVRHPLYAALGDAGVLPILSRVVVQGGGGPISVTSPVRAEGTFAVTRTEDERGEVRLRIDMWADMHGVLGRSLGMPVAGAGQSIALGRMFAEHVLTRPFAPPEQRKVDALPIEMALRRERWLPPHELLALPPGATLITGEEADPTITVFGLGHTDSNQHVNSLVYPLLLEEAALRFAARHANSLRDLGLSNGSRFAHFLDLRYRKPFFAGEACQIVLAGYRDPSRPEVLGVIARLAPPEGSPRERANAYAHLELIP